MSKANHYLCPQQFPPVGIMPGRGNGVVVVLAEPGGVADELDGLSGFEEEERD